MRTTIDIDDDLLAVARQLADQDQISLGRAVSSLMRKALEAPKPSGRVRNGVRLFEPIPGAPKPTLELINRLRDEL